MTSSLVLVISKVDGSSTAIFEDVGSKEEIENRPYVLLSGPEFDTCILILLGASWAQKLQKIIE